MSEANHGVLKDLSPAEIEYIKGQVAHMLNYTKQGVSVAAVPANIRSKITDAMRQEIVKKVEALLK